MAAYSLAMTPPPMHQQAARQIGQREDGIAVEHVFVIHGQVRRRARPRTGGDDDDGRAHAWLRAVDARIGELVRRATKLARPRSSAM